MDKNLKSIAYAFISHDIDIYTPDGENDCFIVNRLVCKECGEFWHTSLQECYFCGTINYYLYECTECGEKYSITKSSKKCDSKDCNGALIKKCTNNDCISNTNTELANAAKQRNGVFELDSSMNLSLMHCIACGRKENMYKEYRLFVHVVDEFVNVNEIKSIQHEKNIFSDNDLLLLKKRYDPDNIHYSILSKYDIDRLEQIPEFTPDFSEIVSHLFPVKNLETPTI